jgi:hypothetical protein
MVAREGAIVYNDANGLALPANLGGIRVAGRQAASSCIGTIEAAFRTLVLAHAEY